MNFFQSWKKPIDLDKPVIHILILAIFGFLVYSNTLYSPFLLDDHGFVLHNPYVKNPLKLYDKETPSDPASERFSRFNSSRRMVFLTFALNYKLNGFNPTAFRLFNIMIHLINSWFVYLLVVVTFKTPKFLKYNNNEFTQIVNPIKTNHIALFTALFFVCHPVQTMAVTYITQRFASLATFFYILSLLAYINSRIARSKTKHYLYYISSIISAILAMKSKEISLTLPVVIVLYDFMFFNGEIKKRILYLVPFFLTMVIIPLSIVSHGNTINESITNLTLSQINISYYALTQLRVIVTYIRLLFFPVNLQVDYDYPWYYSFFETEILISFIFLVGIFGLGLFMLNRRRIMSFGIFWFFIALSVESSVIAIPDLIWEHRLYLPSIGFFAALVPSVFFLFAKSFRISWVRKTFICILLSTIFVLGVATYARNGVWQDDVTIWKDNAAKAPNKARVHDNLGIALGRKGILKEAEKEFKIALKLNPHIATTHNNLGTNYVKMGRYDDAIGEFKIALKLMPSFAEAHLNLGIAYRKQGRIEEAIEAFKRALEINPRLAPARNQLSSIFSDN